MGKILAYASALLEYFFDCRTDGCHPGIETEVSVDAGCEISKGIQQGTARGKGSQSVRSKLRLDADPGRLELVLGGVDSVDAVVAG